MDFPFYKHRKVLVMKCFILAGLFLSSFAFGSSPVAYYQPDHTSVETRQIIAYVNQDGEIIGDMEGVESVTVHGTVNGITTVSCTGGCIIDRGFIGTTVCDQNNVCIAVGGKIQEKKEKEESTDE